MSFLGIDIGSSQVKAAAFDLDGSCLCVTYRKYAYQTPYAGWMELDAEAVLQAALAAIRECAVATVRISPVQALAVSSQGEAFAALDADGRILSPSMISGDFRATAEIVEFTGRLGSEKLYRITGHTPAPVFTLAKLLWFRKHRPELMARARHFFCFEDLLVYTLTGRAAMGWSLAGRTMLFDIRTHAWSREILDELGITPECLADPLPSGTAVGTVTGEMAATLQLAEGVVVATGGHDQVVGAFGCGVGEPGSAMFAAGSVECMVPVLDRRVQNDALRRMNLCTYDFVLPDRWATLAYSLTGSNMQEYFMREFGRDCDGDYGRLLDAMPDQPSSLLVLPNLTASGTPWFDTVTPGCVFGWRFDHTRGELLKGFWEGIAMSLRFNVELLKESGINVRKLIAAGGGFRHPAVVQLHADILELPIAVTAESEAGCRGAARLACRAAAPAAVLPPPPIIDVVRPRSGTRSAYERKFIQWQQFTQTIRSFAQWQSCD